MMLARDIPKPETYGVPTVYAAGDVNRDGVCDGYDPQDWDDYNDYGAGALAADLDVNRDGVVDSADRALVQGHADWALWTSHGRGSVSRLHNRRGYAGYEYDPATQQWHVRHRVLVSEMGRWNRRDPLGYVDGMSLYEYVGSRAVEAVDPSGLMPPPAPGRRDNSIAWYLTTYYYSQMGGYLNLNAIGDWVVDWYLSYPHVRLVVEEIDDRIESIIEREALLLGSKLRCCRPEGPQTLDATVAFTVSLNVPSGMVPLANIGMWTIGGHYIHARSACMLRVTCGNNTIRGWVYYSYWCVVNYSMRDTFTKPLKFIHIPIDDPRGAAFDYGLDWSKLLKGSGIVDKLDWDARDCIRGH